MAQVLVYNFTHTSSLGGQLVSTASSTGPLLFSGVIVNTPGSSANVLTIYNGTSTAGAVVANIMGPSTGGAPFFLTYNVTCNNNIFIGCSGGVAPDSTVIWA